MDKEEVRNADEAQTVQFVEGVLKDSVKIQLRMLKIPMPGKTFMEFKKAAITIVGNPAGPSDDYPEVVGAVNTSPEKTQKVADAVIKGAQNSPGGPITDIKKTNGGTDSGNGNNPERKAADGETDLAWVQRIKMVARAAADIMEPLASTQRPWKALLRSI